MFEFAIALATTIPAVVVLQHAWTFMPTVAPASIDASICEVAGSSIMQATIRPS